MYRFLNCSFLALFSLFPLIVYTQTHHYETIVTESDEWAYFIGDSEPPSNWRAIDFDDSQWERGIGGLGFGDNDDATEVPRTGALYIRRNFTIIDKSVITSMLLDIDYDDGFVAYLNGEEIARSGVEGAFPPFDAGAEDHEALIKQGKDPERYLIPNHLLTTTLQVGDNVLAIQVHNTFPTSSDLSIRPFLTVGVSMEATIYGGTHPYFIAPVILQASNLPIVLIDTENGAPIVDDPKVTANLSVIHDVNKTANLVTDFPNVYDGNIGIEIRGNTSAAYPQAPFAFELKDELGENINAPLLGMPKENDWIFLSNWNDKVMMRNVLTYHLFREMGHYAPRTRYCEVVLNGNYEGIYVLTEKIKQDDNRVDIANLRPEEIEGDDLTGGYIFKVDNFESDGSDSWLGNFTPERVPQNDVRFVYHDPKASKIVPEQAEYLQAYVNGFETVLFGDNFEDPTTGYRAFINVESFIDYLIISELSRNVDAYKKSKYYFKDKDSKGGLLNSGPVWDYDWAYKNINGQQQSGSGWSNVSFDWMWPTPNGWIERMLKDPWFEQKWANRYHALRQTILSETYLFNFIDQQHDTLAAAQNRHFQRWKTLGINVGAPEGNEPQPDTFEGEVTKFKQWLSIRLFWLDRNMPEEMVVTSTDDLIEPVVGVRVFPNPTTDYVFVEATEKIQQISVVNVSGEVVKVIDTKLVFTNKIELADLNGGAYFLRVKFKDLGLKVLPLIKE